jgi:hypothetical protein
MLGSQAVSTAIKLQKNRGLHGLNATYRLTQVSQHFGLSAPDVRLGGCEPSIQLKQAFEGVLAMHGMMEDCSEINRRVVRFSVQHGKRGDRHTLSLSWWSAVASNRDGITIEQSDITICQNTGSGSVYPLNMKRAQPKPSQIGLRKKS